MPSISFGSDILPPASRRPSKVFIVKGVMVLVVGVIVFQLAGGIWDRIILQSQMKDIRNNINRLQKTMTAIDTTYDNLNSEILALADVAYQRLPISTSMSPDGTISRDINKRSMRSYNNREQRANLIKNAIDEIEAKNAKTDPTVTTPLQESERPQELQVQTVLCADNITKDASVQKPNAFSEKSTAMHKNAGMVAQFFQESRGAGSFQLSKDDNHRLLRSYCTE